MTQISVSELKTNTGKYVGMAQEQDILITKNGKVVAKLVTAKVDKKAALNRLFQLYENVEITEDEISKAREERLT